MSNIAIITARGGSKRIPKKNIRDFLGKPIIAYSIEAALNSNIFDIVMVSTDDEEIAKIAKEYGAEVPFYRTKKTSDDFASTEDVLIEVLDKYHEIGKDFDTICCLYPTAPLVSSEDLKKAYQLLIDNKNVDSVVPVVRFSYPPQRGLIIKNQLIQFSNPEYAKARSQDLIPIYHDCGQFYFSYVEPLRKYCDLIAPHCLPYIMEEERVQDIDNYSDWDIAEIKYKKMKGI